MNLINELERYSGRNKLKQILINKLEDDSRRMKNSGRIFTSDVLTMRETRNSLNPSYVETKDNLEPSLDAYENQI